MSAKQVLTDLNIGGSVTSTSFIKSGGTAAQFLKADGSVDTNIYAIDNNMVHISGTETITGLKRFSAFTAFGGITTPMQSIHTDGIIRAGVYFESDDRDFIEIIPNGQDSRIRSINERFHITNQTGYLILQDTGGHVGIKTLSPSEQLSVVGNIAFGETEGKCKMIYNSTESSIDFIIN